MVITFANSAKLYRENSFLHKNYEKRINGGSTVAEGTANFVVLVHIRGFNILIHGVFYKKTFVITTGTPINLYEAKDIKISFGSTDTNYHYSSKAMTETIDVIEKHDLYNYSCDQCSNIAVLVLDCDQITGSSLPHESVILPEKNFVSTGTPVTIFGWGQLDINKYPDKMQSLGLTIISTEQCNRFSHE